MSIGHGNYCVNYMDMSILTLTRMLTANKSHLDSNRVIGCSLSTIRIRPQNDSNEESQ